MNVIKVYLYRHILSRFSVAEESHATKTQFVFNADLVSETDGHHQDIASMVYPALGLASDQDPAYQVSPCDNQIAY